MSNESPVTYASDQRIHVALAVTDLERSIEFYRVLFGREPTKVRPKYSKFEVADPPLNLALNESTGPTGPVNPVAHFGVQVKSPTAVTEMIALFNSAGLETEVEEEVACCYAVQNKVWVSDPDGHRWEVFVVLDESDQYASDNSACCTDATECCDSSPACC